MKAVKDETPKMFAKFVQLLSHSNELYALDENGEIFRRDLSGNAVSWKRQLGRNE